MYSKGNIMSNLEQQIQAEQQRLYEVASLTDEMEDDNATMILEWASAQITALAGDGTQLEVRAKQLRRLVGDINYFIGGIEDKPSGQMQEELGQIYQTASELGYPAQQRLLLPLIEQLVGQPPADVLVILIAWLENDSLLADILGGDSE